jgi:hypothetical protein
VKRLIFCLTAVALLLAVPAAAQARWFGSKMRGAANVNFGCEAAPILDPITGAPELVSSGQRTCTYRHAGYLNTNRITALVPANGRIVRVRVRAGRNPAPLRVTILNASSSAGFSCCTAIRKGRVFRPRANRVTTIATNFRVHNVVDTQRGFHTTDVMALTAVGPGTLPLRDVGGAGSYATGNPFAGFWYPGTAIGDPRVDQTTAGGLDLLFQWDFRHSR